MRDDFAVFILTYGRPDNVRTYRSIRRQGYTGRIFIVTDDSDPAIARYRENYGDAVLVFSKDEIAEKYDQGDNFADRRSVFYARNACWSLAERVGCRFFVELDDDYGDFKYRRIGKMRGEAAPRYHGWQVQSLDRVFEVMVEFVEQTGCASLAMSQGGDHIGGFSADIARTITLSRKAMNSFVCDAERPFAFRGRVNEDVNTYVSGGNTGLLFFTYGNLQLDQEGTQSNPGGMTGLYLDSGTYIKSFYSVMYAPSCVTVQFLADMRRLHHVVRWDNAVPKIMSETWRKVSDG